MIDIYIGNSLINEKIISNVTNKVNNENVDLIVLGVDIIEMNYIDLNLVD